MGLSRDKGKKVPDDLEALFGGSLEEAIVLLSKQHYCLEGRRTAAE